MRSELSPPTDLANSPAPRSYERPALRPLNRTRWHALTLITGGVDILAIGLALVAATATRFGGEMFEQESPYGMWMALWLPMWWLGLLATGLYERHIAQNPAEELRRILYGVTLSSAIAVIASFTVQFPLSRGWLLLSWGFALVAVALGRRGIRKTVHGLRRRGRLRRRAVIVGADPSGKSLAEDIAGAPWEGLDVIGFVSVNGLSPSEEVAPVLGSADQLRDLAMELQISDVLVAPSVAGNGHFGEVLSALDGVPVDLSVAPGMEGFLASRLNILPVADRPLLSVERAELNPSARFVKRALDIGLGSLLLLLSLPILAVCAVAIRIDSPGPVFFRQPRVGLRGRQFTMWKLRTMCEDAEDLRLLLDDRNEAEGITFKIQLDPRVTRVGRVLRRTSLDEVPQLINVLAGHMSLVGPRPPLPSEVSLYSDHIGRRLLVKPGMTGLWQVRGRSDLTFEDYVRYDLMYVQNWSLALDLYILLKTIPAVALGRGAR
jgi:exopolysaccharide biosynthesis polyprenyl glycosylphosphotransferase